MVYNVRPTQLKKWEATEQDKVVLQGDGVKIIIEGKNVDVTDFAFNKFYLIEIKEE